LFISSNLFFNRVGVVGEQPISHMDLRVVT